MNIYKYTINMGKMFIHIHFLYRYLSLRIERFWMPKRYDLNTPGLAGISITSHNEATGIDRDIVVICSHGNLVYLYLNLSISISNIYIYISISISYIYIYLCIYIYVYHTSYQVRIGFDWMIGWVF